MLYRGDPWNELAAYLQQAWADVGVEMTPEPLPFPTLLERTDARDFEMVIWGSAGRDPGQGWMFATAPATTSSATAMPRTTGSKPSNGAPSTRRGGST
jgi:ABC-type transport system substrate-binding protein